MFGFRGARFFDCLVFCLFSLIALLSLATPAAAQTKIIIARHGTSGYDPKNPPMINGVPNPSLSDVGREEAAHLAQLAKAEGIEMIVHSPLIRARETATIVARELNLTPMVIEALTEFQLGDLNGKDWSVSPYREQLAEVFRHPDNKRPGGESFNEMYERVTAVLRDLLDKHPNKKILIVAHGITNRALVGWLRQLSTAEAYALPSQPNNEAFIVEWRGKLPIETIPRRY